MRAVAHSVAAVTALAAAPFAAAALTLRPDWRVGVGERLGGVAAPAPGAVWVHGASVGELLAALPLVDRLRRDGRAVFVSSQTVSGREALRKVRPELPCQLAPLDHPWCAERALARVRPAALVLVETELWPGWIAAADRRGVPVLLLSGRLSDRSFARYLRARPLVGRTLRRLHSVGARTPSDAERFRDLGARRDTVVVTGDLKLDAHPRAATLAGDLEVALGGSPLFVAGSTHPGEERAVLAAFDAAEREGARVALVLAPRHPGRFDTVAALVREAGRTLRRRSALAPTPIRTGEVLLLDTLGELAAVYGRAAAAFVGGSIAAVGGHNVLEPVLAGAPVLFGPHTSDVEHATAILASCGAGRRVADARELGRAMAEWLADPAAAKALAARGCAALAPHRGSAARSASLVEGALTLESPQAER